jgi:hypothetical protein
MSVLALEIKGCPVQEKLEDLYGIRMKENI